jgi:hypothetical protein
MEYVYRIQGIALVNNTVAADAIALQLPNANYDKMFTTGLPLRAIGSNGPVVAHLANVLARTSAATATQAMINAGIPPSIVAARVVAHDDNTLVTWIASCGYEMCTIFEVE